MGKWLYPNPECSASTQMTSACVSSVRRQRTALNKLAPESRLGLAHRPCGSAGSKDFPTKPSHLIHRSLAALSSSSSLLQLHQSQPRSSNAHPKAQKVQLCVLRLLQELCLFSSLLAPPPPPLLAGLLLPFFDELDCYASPSPIDH